MQEQLKLYALLCQKEKDVKLQKESVKKVIEEEIGQKEYAEKTSVGTFKMVKTHRWTYSPELVEKEEDLKIQKQDEQENGTAEAATLFSLRFNPKK